MIGELGMDHFVPFMREVTGFDPFPWQRRLLAEVLGSGWPDLLDLPTGTGKTSVLLIALFALAVKPEGSARRIALVVDRRIIVDQVHDFAQRLYEALRDPARPASARVAARLRSLASYSDANSPPVRVVHLRGGIPRDDTWIQDPDQPTILASTVDQVGSRLLFRGYGVSDGMRPVHAGILARDTLYFLDEVHLAAAFEETLGRLEGTYAKWAERGGTGRPFKVVRMSATPRAGGASPAPRVFGLDAADRAHPVLAQRLTVSRSAELEVVKTKRTSDQAARSSNNDRVAAHLHDRAIQARESGAQAIGVVVNRVDTARRVAALLRQKDKVEVLLMTGRMRPFERAAIQAELGRTVAVGATRVEGAPPTFVVATSCIEAGADLDFDALITEVASLDALRQRFGRLNRLGKHPSSWAWVIARSDQISATGEPDPVYGTALRETWNYLNANAEGGRVDFGLEAFKAPADAEVLRSLLPPADPAPVLFPSYLDMWSETRPAPHPDPDPALWLHGKNAKPERDISVVFRADVPPPVLDDPVSRDRAAEALEFLPPVAEEAVSVPLREFSAWLGTSSAPNAANDLEDDESTSTSAPNKGAPAWRWSADGPEAVPLTALRLGDTVIVPASWGGLGLGTWDPSAREAVEDVAELAAHPLRKVAKLRLDPSTLPVWLQTNLPTPPDQDDPELLESERARCVEWLRTLGEHLDPAAPDEWRKLLQEFGGVKKPSLKVATSANGNKIWRVAASSPKRAVEATTEDAVSVFTGIRVCLDDHLRDVEAWAQAFVRAAGVDDTIAGDIALAARLHDIGKADMRFQALLHGGDPIAAAGGVLLAKSLQSGSQISRLRAERRSGWPSGLRHELVSLALLDASPALQARAHDLELVRHLVASHHGWCRPWAPALLDPQPMQVRVGVDGSTAEVSTAALDPYFLDECASRFRRLCRRYGWHGLAYLEALLRLADHRASAQPGARPGGDA